MKRYWISFRGEVSIKADSHEEAGELFRDFMNGNETGNINWEDIEIELDRYDNK